MLLINEWSVISESDVFSVVHVLPVIFRGEEVMAYTAGHHQGAASYSPCYQHAAADETTQREPTEWKKTGMDWRTRKILLVNPDPVLNLVLNGRTLASKHVMLSATWRHTRPTASTLTRLVQKNTVSSQWAHSVLPCWKQVQGGQAVNLILCSVNCTTRPFSTARKRSGKSQCTVC